MRIGISMRMVQSEHGERRDALAHDWHRFLRAALPGTAWCAIPNIGREVLDFVDAFGLTALILSGGDDFGVCEQRDDTEQTLLAHALHRNWPVLGVCRGTQLLWRHFGGALTEQPGHVATRHRVRFEPDWQEAGEIVEVNSYHRWGLDATTLPVSLSMVGRTEQGEIEAVSAAEHRMLGLMWHPERELQPARHDLALVQRLFDVRVRDRE